MLGKLGSARLVFLVEPLLRAQGSGVIITLGNTPTLENQPTDLLYVVAKAGNKQLMEGLAAQHRAVGVAVGAVDEGVEEEEQRVGAGQGAVGALLEGELEQGGGGVVHAADADLLVVGARGEALLRHALLGSTASRLLRKSAARPVLMVKQPPHQPYRRVLIPVDFSPASTRALHLVQRLAPGAHLILLHVFHVPFEGRLSYAGVDKAAIHTYRRRRREDALQHLHALAADAAAGAGSDGLPSSASRTRMAGLCAGVSRRRCRGRDHRGAGGRPGR